MSEDFCFRSLDLDLRTFYPEHLSLFGPLPQLVHLFLYGCTAYLLWAKQHAKWVVYPSGESLPCVKKTYRNPRLGDSTLGEGWAAGARF